MIADEPVPGPGADPEIDNDGYPTAETLARIETWDPRDFPGLCAFVKALWYYPSFLDLEPWEMRASTGGWSGNEDIIAAIERNRVWWLLHWYSSSRGGHHVFRPIYKLDDAPKQAEAATRMEAEAPGEIKKALARLGQKGT